MLENGSVTPVVRAPMHAGHQPKVEVQCGRALPAFDTVDRMNSILSALELDTCSKLVDPAENIDLMAAMARVHEPGLIRFIENAWQEVPREHDELDLIFADTFLHPGLKSPGSAAQDNGTEMHFGRYAFDTITGIGPGTWSAARGSVASALTAAELVAGGHQLALALCRPPGHHVTSSVFGGGCYLNNAAITAQWLTDHGSAKVAVIDVDFHHGNGTQAIFYDRADVIYASLHGDPSRSYPFFTGYADETGESIGKGANINVPLPPEANGVTYLDRLGHALEKIDQLSPDIVVVSLGFDTYRDDPAGDAQLETPDYEDIGNAISSLGKPMVALLEGGYWTPSLGANVAGWLTGAADRGK